MSLCTRIKLYCNIFESIDHSSYFFVLFLAVTRLNILLRRLRILPLEMVGQVLHSCDLEYNLKFSGCIIIKATLLT